MKASDILQYKFNHAHPVQVRYNDLDLAGHVNNAVFHEYFDLGRTFYFREVLGEDAINRNQGIVIVQANTTFIKEVFLEDELQVLTKIIRFGNSSFDMLQALVRNTEAGIELVTFAITTFVCMNYTEGNSQAIPLEWIKAMGDFDDVLCEIKKQPE